MNTTNSEEIVSAVKKGNGDSETAQRYLTLGWNLSSCERDAAIRGHAKTMTGPDAISHQKYLEAREAIGRRR